MKPTARETSKLPRDEISVTLKVVNDSPWDKLIIIGKQRVNRVKHIKLFNPVRTSRKFVTSPSESYSLRTRRVAAGAVAIDRIPRHIATGAFVVKKRSEQKTIMKVKKVSHREMVITFFPIFLKCSFWNSPPILNAIRPSARSHKKRSSEIET
jgi:hypothetical protein